MSYLANTRTHHEHDHEHGGTSAPPRLLLHVSSGLSKKELVAEFTFQLAS